jgi:hypothetical protein
VDHAGLEAGGGKGALDNAVIASGAFDGHEAIVELVVGEGLANARNGGVEGGSVMGGVCGNEW